MLDRNKKGFLYSIGDYNLFKRFILREMKAKDDKESFENRDKVIIVHGYNWKLQGDSIFSILHE